jgi:hypothetical protein
MLESLNLANAGVPNNRPYAKPKMLSRRAMLGTKLFCSECHEVGSVTEYSAATKVALLECGHYREA